MTIRKTSKISMILVITTIVLGCIGSTTADNIMNFSEYQKEVNGIQTKNISKTQTLQQIMKAKNMPCEYTGETKDTYIVSPSCLLKNDLPQIAFKEAIDYLRPHIESFNTVYNDTEQTFSYQGTSPIFTMNYEILPKTVEEKLTLIYLQNIWKKLRIHKSSIAYQIIKRANFYTAYKNTSILKRCTKQNYTVALNQIDGKILWSGWILNLNKEIMNLNGYCKWWWPQDLLFYWWVCWFATQLFRTSLLVPTIKITKRYAHSERLVPYYSDYVFWDDAALYQMNKQLEIKNIGESELYFKVLDKWNGNYFVIITSEKNTQWVIISKKQTKKLAWEVQRTIYKGSSDIIIKKDSFTSTYVKKNYVAR